VVVETIHPDYSACKASCPPPTYRIVLTGSPGEENRVTVVKPPEGEIVLSDSGAALEPGGGCRALTANEVACRRDASVDVRLGDGDDSVAMAGTYLTADGGPGADTLTGAEFTDRLTGGPGDDRLNGGAGDDTLLDRDMAGRRGTPGDDSVDGGPGLDLLSYAGRVDPLAIDLGDGAPDGARGEADAIAGVENLTGGLGDDRLGGDELRNVIKGENGDDDVRGAGGNDELSDGKGEDRLDGGAGNDFIASGGESYYYYPDGLNRVACGDGFDRVSAGVTSRVGDDCEAIHLARALMLPQRPLRSLDDPVMIVELQDECGYGCGSPIRLRMPRGRQQAGDPKPGTTLAKGPAPVGQKGTRTEVKLTAAGRELLRRRGSARAVVFATDIRFELTLRLEPDAPPPSAAP
jgi:Ca2+-binding RTX toxin-like protein